ncbi:MAG: NAD(P)/FAD-dependent oxidoreductase [Erythrobacter sp.]|nr:NAD(P)/FAD-dependent oxidoreductase [Erythrobacter sp.]MDZ4273969.1 NAD(P)/FAD-dependent oxidoreductase [Erythrobacter sp.]
MLATPPDFDVLIVGAGISGIGMAAHMKMKTPHHSYAIVEQRDNLGGTWDLFRYPGIRSDSDMYTLGYEFEPWREKETLAQRDRILRYLKGVVDKYGIRPNIQFGKKVLSASFDSARSLWTIELEGKDGACQRVTAKWLYLGSGYYSYDEPYDPGFDFSAFEGVVAHPQFWPEDLDYASKRVVVIGSGATAVTMVPAMAATARKVTMLQRTPTYLRSVPLRNVLFRTIRALLPESVSHRVLRWINIRVTDKMFKTAKEKPDLVRQKIERENRRILGDKYRKEDYTPPYNPWDQRMCFMPDADLFEAIKADKAEIVTARIETFERDGVRLTDGRLIETDIVVTATGLQLLMAGGIEIKVDGEVLVPSEHFYYKSAMISDVPNLTHPVPYVNAGATLRFDLIADYTCRVLKHMRASGNDIAVAALGRDHHLKEGESYAVEAGYVLRNKDALPKSTDVDPWRLSHDYVHDREYMNTSPIDDGVLVFRKAGANVRHPGEQLEAAE